jgi:hypothetical protein
MFRSLLLAAALTLAGVLAPTGVMSGSPSARALDHTPWRLPVTPPRCSVADADSGDVADCLLAFYDDPADTGWGVPPAPGVGSGWEWSGYWYNGSPALASWEASTIGANDHTVAGLAAGRLETHVAAQALFEGFLDEIAANGYRVRDASGYSFRCTNGNGGWSCPSGDPADLSNHAWGLAIDMNAGTNPIRSYAGIDGQTACATPIETDLPRWVIRTAEKWGLYWGGYGWSNGCAAATTQRTIVSRDPPHFEFRGTPAQARAIAEFNLHNDPGATCFATVSDKGADVERCTTSGRPGAGWRLPVDVDAPVGAVAALVNIAVTEPASSGYLTLEDCAARRGPRSTAALTFTAGETIATLAVVPLSDEGRFCVYSGASTQRVVDVVAFLGDTGERLWFDPSTPTRLTDTRTDGSCNALQECHDGPVPDRTDQLVPTADSAPRITNVAVAEAAGSGYLQAGACGSLGPQRSFANLNYSTGAPRSNLAILSGGDGEACIYALRQAHVIVDELGRLDPALGYGWNLARARRVLDTRECSDSWCGDRPPGGSVIRIDAGTDAPAVAVAITATQSDSAGYVWAGPCADVEGRDRTDTANLNHAAGQTVTNLALVELVEGEMCVFNRSATQVIIDIQAELVGDQDVGIIPIDPTRVDDTRIG